MALSEKMQKEYDEWFNSRPQNIKEAIIKCPPTQVYRFKDTKKQCLIISYQEPVIGGNVTLTVQKTGNGGPMAEMGLGLIDTNQVFGVLPEDLETF